MLGWIGVISSNESYADIVCDQCRHWNVELQIGRSRYSYCNRPGWMKLLILNWRKGGSWGVQALQARIWELLEAVLWPPARIVGHNC